MPNDNWTKREEEINERRTALEAEIDERRQEYKALARELDDIAARRKYDAMPAAEKRLLQSIATKGVESGENVQGLSN